MFIFYKHFIGQIERKPDLGLIRMVPGRKNQTESKSLNNSDRVTDSSSSSSRSSSLPNRPVKATERRPLSSSSLSAMSAHRAVGGMKGCFGLARNNK